MDDQRWSEVWKLFFEVLEEQPAEREAAIESGAASDVELQCEVRELLAAHDTAGPFLAAPPAMVAALDSAEPDTDPLLGTWLGPYHLLEVIGSGGMGVVYAAEQERPVRRRVACKVIRAGLESREVIARFAAEREALARMSHSSIARVLDAGATDDGRPYVVMELVDGLPITEFCDTQRLTLDDRLDLFCTVCEAVQHAHQKGVIHRDLKPSNVLVTVEGERPLPKIIDFGIAKALDQPLTPDSTETMFGQLIGTPVYMSPEQVGFERHDVDTRTDVYALSVMLYELIAGVVPFDGELMRRVGFAEFERIVRTRDAEPPAARYAALEAKTADDIAARRRTTAAELRRALRGDLDAITLKGLAKDRGQRYPTAIELGADVRRLLAGDAVLAQRPSRTYRLRKFIARHRVGVALSALLAALLVAFATTVSVQAVHLRNALAQTALERDRSTRVAEFLTHLFTLSDPNVSNGESITVRSVLDRGVQQIETDLADNPETRAALLDTMARSYRALGFYDQSAALLDRALSARRGIAHDPVGLAGTLRTYGEVEQDRGNGSASEKYYRDAIALRATAGARDAGTADTLMDLAVLLRDRGDYDGAIRYGTEALDLRRRLAKGPTDDVATGMFEVGRAYLLKGDAARAAPLYESALAMTRTLHGTGHILYAQALADYQTLPRHAGRYAEARDLLQQSLAIYRRVLGERHSYVAAVMVDLAGDEYYLSNYPEAARLADAAIAIYEELFGPENASIGAASLMVANARAALGDYPAAEIAMRRALAVDRKAEGEDTADVAGDYEVLGTIVRGRGRLAEAAELHTKALAMRGKLLGPDNAGTAASRISLAVDTALLGQATEAAAEARAALETTRQAFGKPHPRIAGALYWVGRILEWDRDFAGAEAAHREALAMRRQLLGAKHADVGLSLAGLGSVVAARGRRGEAISLYREALDLQRSLLPATHPDLAFTEAALGALLCADGDFAAGQALLLPSASRLAGSLPASDPRLRPVDTARRGCARH